MKNFFPKNSEKREKLIEKLKQNDPNLIQSLEKVYGGRFWEAFPESNFVEIIVNNPMPL